MESLNLQEIELDKEEFGRFESMYVFNYYLAIVYMHLS